MAKPPESTKTSLRQRLAARARERWPQLDTEFLGQDLPGPVILLDRLGRAARCGQRTDQLAPQRLTQLVLAGQRLQLGDDPVRPARVQVKLSTPLHRQQGLLDQLGYHVPVQSSGTQVAESLTAPDPSA